MADQRGDGVAGPQWTDEVADRIETLVGTVRDKTAVPATKVARGVVFGLVGLIFGIVAIVLFIIGVLRLHVYLPFHPEARRLWTTYAGLGAIFLIAGLFIWRKRQPRPR
jgi:hypothetical protein